MTALKVIGIILLIFILIGFLRVGALMQFGDELHVQLSVGPFRFTLLPAKEKKETPKKKAKAKKPKSEGEEAKQKAQQEALKKKYTPSKTSIKSIKKLKKNQVKLTWKKVKNATGYEVYQSMKKNSGYKKVKTITKNKKVTYKAGKLKKKKTYYFKIRTYRKAGGTTYYGNYSNVKKMKVK